MDDVERLLRLADEAGVAGDMARAEELFADAERAAGADERLRARVDVGRGYLRQVSTAGGVEAFPDLATRAIDVLERHGDHEGLVTAWKAVARAANVSGDSAGAADACERALRHCELAGIPPNAYVLYLLGVELVNGPAPVADANAFAEERAARGDVHASTPLGLLAECAAMGGDLDRARELAAQYRASFDAEGRVPPVLQAEIELVAGDFAAAEQIAREVYDIQRAMGDLGHGAGSAIALARALLELGRADEAATFAETATATAPADRYVQIQGRAVRARARDDVALAREAVSLADETTWTNVRARVRLDLAALVDEPEARALRDEAVALFEQKGNVVEAARAR